MISVDTNIIVRLLTKDDPAQFKKAYSVFKTEDVYIPITVILETEWVLKYAYNFTSDTINSAFRSLLGLPNVELEDPIELDEALNWYEHGMDFADALHLAKSKAADQFVTFDKKFISKAKKLTNIQIGEP